MKSFKSLLATAAASLFALAPMTSNATLTLTIDDLSDGAGTNVISITDGGAGDLSAISGLILFSGSIGVWVINTETGFGNGVTPTFGIDLLSGNLSTGPGSLRISLSEDNLNYGVNGSSTILGGIGGTFGGTANFGVYANTSNALFDTTGGALVSGTLGPGPASASGSGIFNLADPFSMTLVVDVNHTVAANTTFDFETKIPEPGSLALLSIALLAAGAATRRRKA